MAAARLNMTLTSAKGAFAARMPCPGVAGEAAPGMKCKAMKPATGGARPGAHTIADRGADSLRIRTVTVWGPFRAAAAAAPGDAW